MDTIKGLTEEQIWGPRVVLTWEGLQWLRACLDAQVEWRKRFVTEPQEVTEALLEKFRGTSPEIRTVMLCSNFYLQATYLRAWIICNGVKS